MNNFNYLLLIILLIILLFYIYINCNIEYFQQLPKADLGPIKFVDADNTDEVLGKYPPDWDESELYREHNNLEPTIIKIKRGPRGSPGAAGTGGQPGNCKGHINISSINGDKLEINSSKLNILSENVKFKKKLCFGDDNLSCLDKDLINKIYANKTIQNNLESLEEKIKDNTYVPGSLLNAKVTELATAVGKRDKYKKEKEDCNNLINDPDQYVTRELCDQQISNAETPLQTQLGETGSQVSDMQNFIDDLSDKLSKCNGKLADPSKYRTYAQWNQTNQELNTVKTNNSKLEEEIALMKNQWCKKNAHKDDNGCKFSDLHNTEQKYYGEKVMGQANQANLNIDGSKYIQLKDCEWKLAKDKTNYGRKIDEHLGLEQSRVALHGNKWGLIKSPSVGDNPIGLYGKITQPDGKNPQHYIKQGDCKVNIAVDSDNYGSKTDYGLIGGAAGNYGKIGDGADQYMLRSKCGIENSEIRATDKKINIDGTDWGKIGTNNNFYGKIGQDVVSMQEYNEKEREITDLKEKKDFSDVDTINAESQRTNLDIGGNSLMFEGESVEFKNQFCIKNVLGQKQCLTLEDIKKMNSEHCGETGEAGVCSP